MKSVFNQNILIYSICLLTVSSLLNGCTFKNTEDQNAEAIKDDELCYFHFYIINNQAKIYVDGELVHDTKPINGKVSSERSIPISEHLSPGTHTIKVELYNGEGILDDKYDKYWEIYYELFVNGVPVDYIHEQTDNGKQGLVWSEEHEIVIKE
ncbi:hypothetical protein [Marinoscillum furvescens]|uniref:hypothetical protein n=1 Tax=Marinoscillum furvescens TaxID=1026 RepID=UPI0011C02D79|nr:hypothetical protein [Marinoscillum furvescens]